MARTKRKVNPIAAASPAPAAKEEKRYKVAAYARLSVEDSGKRGSETLESQKRLIMEYINSAPDMEFCSLYFDNGESGTDFHRPGFEKMMDAVRKGEINCIVVKDLSRFGRNYKETGNYLERIFPFLGVRFIAITDNFDTLTAERGANGYIVPLKNLINETYSRDISKKISSALHIKQESGEFIGNWAPYGYSKSPEDIHKLIPNPDTAPIVQRIFQMRLQGLSYQAIATSLNDEGISSPSRYLVEVGICKSETYAKSVWKGTNIKHILKHQVYIGHMVQGVERQSFYDGIKHHFPPAEEWIIVPNTHEAIIDEETFSAVQETARQAHDTYFKNLGKFDDLSRSENILQGLVFCSHCSKPLVRYRQACSAKGTKIKYIYSCPTHKSDKRTCPFTSIREDKLFPMLQEAISRQIALAIDMEALTTSVNDSPAKRQKVLTLQTQLEQERKALTRCEGLRDSLYQNYVEKLMTEREYMAMKERYAAEVEDHKARIMELERQQEAAKVYTAENHFLASFSLFKDASVLSREVLTALVDRIEIAEGQHINIRFRYRDEFDKLIDFLREEAAPDEYRSKVSPHFE